MLGFCGNCLELLRSWELLEGARSCWQLLGVGENCWELPGIGGNCYEVLGKLLRTAGRCWEFGIACSCWELLGIAGGFWELLGMLGGSFKSAIWQGPLKLFQRLEM